MTKKEIKELAKELVEVLKKMPDGTETSSGRLLFENGYEPDKMDLGDLFVFDRELRRAAKANKLILDSSMYDGMDVGLPFNIEFVVYHGVKPVLK